MKLRIEKHLLKFIKPAKTSRGSYTEKVAHLLILETPSGDYFGEVSPLPDLSVDGSADFVDIVNQGLMNLGKEQLLLEDLYSLQEEWSTYPALRFGLNSIVRDLVSSGSNQGFIQKKWGIPINGLVWMNDIESMEEEAFLKIEAGFNIIKFKVGALDFDAECRLLERIRKKYSAFDLEIRLDANGGFSADTALSQLRDLKRFDIHSLEQPIPAKMWDDMQRICAISPIDIALDEELIGYSHHDGSDLRSDIRKLIEFIQPKYVILKPTFIGGFDRCDLWVEELWKKDLGWWSTSALEGNVGLFAIAKWASNYALDPRFMVQGLGTGSLFVKNFPANTEVKNGHLYAL